MCPTVAVFTGRTVRETTSLSSTVCTSLLLLLIWLLISLMATALNLITSLRTSLRDINVLRSFSSVLHSDRYINCIFKCTIITAHIKKTNIINPRFLNELQFSTIFHFAQLDHLDTTTTDQYARTIGFSPRESKLLYVPSMT